jgi:hypothetical protein
VPSKPNLNSEQVIVEGETAGETRSKQNQGEHSQAEKEEADNTLQANGRPFNDGDMEPYRTADTDEREKRTDSGEDNDYAGRGTITES